MAMIILAYAIVAQPLSRDIENFEVIRKQRNDRLVLLAVTGVVLIGSGTVWGLLQRIEPPD